MDEELAECLLMWVQTFSVDGARDSVQSLSDGAALGQILHEVAPTFFTEEWLSGINSEEANNKHLKISNLKKILRAVISYCDDELSMRISESKKPNLKLIVEGDSLLEMGRLLQLVLGCAVNCDNKQDYIQAIMGMEESVQHGVMTAIQELMTAEPTTPHDNDGVDLASQLQNALRELAESRQSTSELSERCHELDRQVASLLEEKSNLENQSSSSEKMASDDIDDPNTTAGKKYQAVQQQLEQYKDEVYRLDAAKEDYRMKYEYTNKEHTDLKEKVESLTALAEEARTLRDEVDVLRQNEERIKVYENTIESYKRKLEDMADLRRTVKLLEEKNTSYMEKSVEWEEQAKKTSALKSQMEVYKRQVQDLQTKLTAETKRADKHEFECKRVQEKVSGLQTEKDRLTDEVQSLRESHEELEFSKLALSTDSTSAGEDDLELLSLPPQLKEKFIRLQTQNRILNKKLSEGGDTSALQSNLDDAHSRINDLESENRISNQRNLELEAQLEDLQEANSQLNTGESDAFKELKKELTEYKTRSRVSEEELAKKKQYMETADTRIAELTQNLKEKDDKLQQRENDMKAQEEKYNKYLEKAKTVLSKVESSSNGLDNSSPQLDIVKAQLLEKEKLIAQIKKEQQRQKEIKDQEEKLMVSAWYNMGMNKHRKAVEERLNQYSSGQSFLSRQRQVHSKRSTAPLTSSNR